MKSREIVAALEEKGINTFTFNDAVRLSGKSRQYVRLMLSRAVAKGYLIRAERGLYYTKRASALEVASNTVQPSYVSLMSAFSYYGITTQIPLTINVITSKRHSAMRFGDSTHARIIFITMKKERVFGFHRGESNINMADIEKAIVDALYLGKPAPGYIMEALETAMRMELLDVKKLKEYASRMGSKVLLKRIKNIVGDR